MMPENDEVIGELLENHDLHGDTIEAARLIDEALADWEHHDRPGKLARIREAKRILDRCLQIERGATRLDVDEDEVDQFCPLCGSTAIAPEEMTGGTRFYCTECDETLQVG